MMLEMRNSVIQQDDSEEVSEEEGEEHNEEEKVEEEESEELEEAYRTIESLHKTINEVLFRLAFESDKAKLMRPIKKQI